MDQGGWRVLQANVPPSLVRDIEMVRPPSCLTCYLVLPHRAVPNGRGIDESSKCLPATKLKPKLPSLVPRSFAVQSVRNTSVPACGWISLRSVSIIQKNPTYLTSHDAAQVMEGFAQVVTVKPEVHLIPPK